jgi:hypothetical protein
MSTFERDDYRWRETYLVFFDASRRPTVQQMRHKLEHLRGHYELSDLVGDEQGMFESVTLRSPEDYSALDISYVQGEEVAEQGAQLLQEFKSAALDEKERARLSTIAQSNALFNILHFEQVVDTGDDELEDMLDPSALLLVLEALARLTHGVGVDPQSGTIT